MTERAQLGRVLAEMGLSLVPVEGELDIWAVTGPTYENKELIRSKGGRWSGTRRQWLFRFEDGRVPTGLAEAPPPAFEAKPDSSPGRGKPHFLGHRERLRERFASVGPQALADYELLEMLLFFSVFRRDTKPLAKRMIERFGGLGALLAAEPDRYAECLSALAPPPGDTGEEPARIRDDDLLFTRVLLKAIHELMQRVLKEEIRDRPVIGSWSALLDYLQLALSHEPIEQFRVMFLDRKNVLIKDEVQQRGTVDHTPLYPREIVKRALELGASAIIMVHNHPSGDPTPSQADLDMTRQVVAALSAVGITLHDHVVVGRNRHLSFKSQRLI